MKYLSFDNTYIKMEQMNYVRFTRSPEPTRSETCEERLVEIVFHDGVLQIVHIITYRLVLLL